MYVSYRTQGMSFMAVSIPPRPREGFPESLEALGRMQYLVQEPGGIAPLALALRAASDDDVRAAVPQLAFAVKEIREAMVSQSVAMAGEERGLLSSLPGDARSAMFHAVTRIGQDTRAALEKCGEKPGHKGRLRFLQEAFETMAEAAIFAGALAKASGSKRDKDNAKAAVWASRGLAEDVARFRAGVGPRYAGTVRGMLADPAETMAGAQARAAADLGPLPELTDRRIEDVAGTLPPLPIFYGDHRNADGSPVTHRPVDPAEVREQVASLLEDYHATFGVGGFSRLMRQAAVVAHWKAERYLTYALDTNPDEARARAAAEGRELGERRPRYPRKSSIPYEEWLDHFSKWRAGYQRDGERAAAMAAEFRGLLADAARVLRPDLAEPRRMAFALDEASGAVVGRFRDEDPDDRVLAVYDDSGEGPHKARVMVLALRAGDVEGGVPDLETARRIAVTGNNYRHLADALSSLGNVRDQQHLLGEEIVPMDLGKVPAPRAPQEAAPGGPRR